MKRSTLTLVAAGIGILLAAAPIFAHHSFAAQYDRNKPVTLKGEVTKVEWMNPHIYVYVDVKDAAGKVINWAVEGGAPNSLYRNGWRKDSLKRGDVITVQGSLAKDGSHLANATSVVLADGKKVFAGCRAVMNMPLPQGSKVQIRQEINRPVSLNEGRACSVLRYGGFTT